jgi:hypothetical protein
MDVDGALVLRIVDGAVMVVCVVVLLVVDETTT